MPVARSGPEINSRACLYVLQGPRQNARCCLPIQQFNFLLIFCLETPRKYQVQWTAEQSHSMRVCWWFHSLSLQHDQGPNIAPQPSGQRCHSTPAGTVIQTEMLFWQPEAPSQPPDYQSKYWHISLVGSEFQFLECRLVPRIPQPERLWRVCQEGMFPNYRWSQIQNQSDKYFACTRHFQICEGTSFVSRQMNTFLGFSLLML